MCTLCQPNRASVVCISSSVGMRVPSGAGRVQGVKLCQL